jgi:hypothetical protein
VRTEKILLLGIKKNMRKGLFQPEEMEKVIGERVDELIGGGGNSYKIAEEILDPDKLYLTKAQIIEIGDNLIARWKKNQMANCKMIIITKAA